MIQDAENPSSKEMVLTNEELGFAAREMRNCASCGRSNPPNRLNCLYCAAEFVISQDDDSQHLKINSRRLEGWEKGFNVIVTGATGTTPGSIHKIAADLVIERSFLETAIGHGTAIPVARVESMRLAELIRARLQEAGVTARVLADAELAAEKPPVRCRAVVFESERIILQPFNPGVGPIIIGRSELNLMVTGALFESKVQRMEKRKKGKSTVLAESETTSDTPLLDIYSAASETGFRIPAAGFDFSVLGADKSLIAAQNLQELVQRLRAFAPDAVFVDSYIDERELLEEVWESDRRKDSLGMQRAGFARKELAAVGIMNNRNQFTKFSRMHRKLV